MSMNPIVLGLQQIADLGVTDPVVCIMLMAAANELIKWTKSNVHASPDNTIPALKLVAAGSSITGNGSMTYTDPATLATAICSAVGMTDPIGKSKISIVSQHYAEKIAQYGVIVPSGLIAYTGPGSGPVTGECTMLLTGDFKFYEALNLTDALSVDRWTKYGKTLWLHINTFAKVKTDPYPTLSTLENPGAGGPCTGLAYLG